MLILSLEILQTEMSPYVKESMWPLDYRSQPMDSGSQIVVLEPELWILDSKLTSSTELDPRFQTMDSGFHALDQVWLTPDSFTPGEEWVEMLLCEWGNQYIAYV